VIGRRPSRIPSEREQRAGQVAEELASRHAAAKQGGCGSWFRRRRFSKDEDAVSRTRQCQFLGFGNGVAHGKHQPIGGCVVRETDLVGERRTGISCDRRQAAS
jgi:hypothetical protein